LDDNGQRYWRLHAGCKSCELCKPDTYGNQCCQQHQQSVRYSQSSPQHRLAAVCCRSRLFATQFSKCGLCTGISKVMMISKADAPATFTALSQRLCRLSEIMGSPEGQTQPRIELMTATFHECCRGQLDIIYDIILTDLKQSSLAFVTESDLP